MRTRSLKSKGYRLDRSRRRFGINTLGQLPHLLTVPSAQVVRRELYTTNPKPRHPVPKRSELPQDIKDIQFPATTFLQSTSQVNPNSSLIRSPG